MRYAVTIAAVGLVVLLAAPVAALGTESTTIGIVDLKRVFEESKYKAEYDQRIEELSKQKQAELDKLKDAFDRRVAEARKEMLLLTDDAKADKNAELAAEARRLQDAQRKAQQEVAEQSRDYLKGLEEKVTEIVEKLAAEHNVDLVLNNAVVIYKKNVQDLTDAVLEKLDEMYDKEHGEPSAEEGE